MNDSKARVMYTVLEASILLGISKSTAHELVIRGELEAVRLGGRRLISPKVIEGILGERPPRHGQFFSTPANRRNNSATLASRITNERTGT